MAIFLVKVISLILVFLGTLAFQFQGFLDLQFGKISIDQLIFFITTSDGTVGADPRIIKSAQLHLTLRPVLITFSVLLIYILLSWLANRFSRNVKKYFELVAKFFATTCIFISLASAYITFSKLGGMEYFISPDDEDYFAQYYTPPS